MPEFFAFIIIVVTVQILWYYKSHSINKQPNKLRRINETKRNKPTKEL